MAGAVSTGAVIRAAEVLGADLAYLGTRFIATQESDAPDEYKELLVSQTSTDLAYTGDIAGVPANWMVESHAPRRPRSRQPAQAHRPRHAPRPPAARASPPGATSGAPARAST